MCVTFIIRGLETDIYRSNPHNMETLQNEIWNVILEITVDELQCVSHSLLRKCDMCINVGEQHFQRLL
jgi:hypothetical protein